MPFPIAFPDAQAVLSGHLLALVGVGLVHCVRVRVAANLSLSLPPLVEERRRPPRPQTVHGICSLILRCSLSQPTWGFLVMSSLASPPWGVFHDAAVCCAGGAAPHLGVVCVTRDLSLYTLDWGPQWLQGPTLVLCLWGLTPSVAS